MTQSRWYTVYKPDLTGQIGCLILQTRLDLGDNFKQHSWHVVFVRIRLVVGLFVEI